MIKNHPNLVSPDILGPRVSPSGLEVPRLPSVPWVLSVRWLHCYLYKTYVSFIPNDQKVIRLALITFHEVDLVAVYYTQIKDKLFQNFVNHSLAHLFEFYFQLKILNKKLDYKWYIINFVKLEILRHQHFDALSLSTNPFGINFSEAFNIIDSNR